LSVEEAIAMYTSAAAYASFDENRKGTLTPGKLADMVVLAKDPRQVEPDTLGSVRIVATLVGGEVAYEAPIAAAQER